MKIVYPSLVEEGYRFCVSQGIETTREAVFLHLIEKNIINSFGFPTDQAIAEGFVSEFTEEEYDSFEQFLSLYPVLKAVNPLFFEQVDGYWEIKMDHLEEVMTFIENHTFSQSEWIQLEAFFEQRGIQI